MSQREKSKTFEAEEVLLLLLKMEEGVYKPRNTDIFTEVEKDPFPPAQGQPSVRKWGLQSHNHTELNVANKHGTWKQGFPTMMQANTLMSKQRKAYWASNLQN